MVAHYAFVLHITGASPLPSATRSGRPVALVLVSPILRSLLLITVVATSAIAQRLEPPQNARHLPRGSLSHKI